MKLEKWLSCLIGTVLAFGIAIAGAGCLVSAFALEPVNMAAVAGICGLCAAVSAVCFSFRRGLVLAAVAAVLMGYLVREGTMVLELESLLHKVTAFYDRGYGVGTVGWSGVALEEVPVTGGLTLIGAVVATAVSWTVCCKKGAFLAVAFGFLPLAACFVVTDTIPQERWLFLMFACFAVLVLTQSVRRRDPKAAVRLTAIVLVPVVLAAALLFWVHPQEGYTVRMDAAQQTLLSWLNKLPFVVTTPEGELTISVDGMTESRVDLSEVGPKARLRYAVMDVQTQSGGLIYLRGQSLDSYDGVSWSASAASTGEDIYFPSRSLISKGWVKVSLRSYQRRTYVPYYISEGYALTEGYIRNDDGVMEYQHPRFEAMDNHTSVSDINYNDPIIQQCLRLPDKTRQEAQRILTDELGMLISDKSRWNTAERADEIGQYVMNSARYSLNTPRMSEEAEDFALWFLEQSDTGYCVHFATAATVLLRATGIPARYVTGYTFQTQKNERTTVRAEDAHAWVEYLHPGKGWTVLDATPAEWMEEAETQPPETRPSVTEPPEIQPTDSPIETEPDPTESTDPLETEPSGTVEPTTPVGGASPGEKQKIDLGWLWTVLKAVLWTACLAAVLVGQYLLRLRLRNKKMRTGHHNQQALARWRYVGQMAKLTGTEPPEELEFLAQKAKFSQHTLTVQELMEFDLWLQQARQTINEKPWITRLVIKLIWAVE